MPADKDAVGTVLKALDESGWKTVRQKPISEHGPNPSEVDLQRAGKVHKILLYAWTTTHEGLTRNKDDLRVQWTPSFYAPDKTLAPVPFTAGRMPVGVGWWPEERVFFLFDVWTKRLSKWSASIHVTRDALDRAARSRTSAVDERRWDPRIAIPWECAAEMIPWAVGQRARREAVIKPIEAPVYNGQKVTVKAKHWGNLATAYIRKNDDIVLIDGRKKLLTPAIWRVDTVTADTAVKPQIVTFHCHHAAVVHDEPAILRSFGA